MNKIEQISSAIVKIAILSRYIRLVITGTSRYLIIKRKLKRNISVKLTIAALLQNIVRII